MNDLDPDDLQVLEACNELHELSPIHFRIVMTSPDKEQAGSLIPRPNTGPLQIDRGERIVSRMVKDALEIARRSSSLPATKLFRVGDFELWEPDYRQVLRWAKGLKWSPVDVLEYLASLTYGKTFWDFNHPEKLGLKLNGTYFSPMLLKSVA